MGPSPCGGLDDPGRLALAFGAAAAGLAARAGPVAEGGGEQLAHLGVDGLERLAEFGEAGLSNATIYIIKPRRYQEPFSPIG